MTATSDYDALDRARLRELFDLRSNVYATARRRVRGRPVPGVPPVAGDRSGARGHRRASSSATTARRSSRACPYPDRRTSRRSTSPRATRSFRDGDDLRGRAPPIGDDMDHDASILFMDGAEHRRYRALVQPSFLPKRAAWWIEQWIDGPSTR